MKNFFILAFLTLLISFSNDIWAANYSNPIEGIFKGNYGDTVVMEVKTMVSRSSVHKSPKGDLAFHVNSYTNYRNFRRLAEIQVGDRLKIAYKEDFNSVGNKVAMGGKTALVITKLEPETVPTGEIK